MTPPEKIYIPPNVKWENNGSIIRVLDIKLVPGDIEYIRADKVEQLVEALKIAKNSLEIHVALVAEEALAQYNKE